MSLYKPFEFDGGVLYMHPRIPIKVNILYNTMPQGSTDWEVIAQDRFRIAEACVNVEQSVFEDDNHPLALYYAGRDGLTTAQRYELFISLIDIDVLNLLYEARTNTEQSSIPIEYPDGVETEGEKKDTLSSVLENTMNGTQNGNGKTKPETPKSKTKTGEPAL